MEHFYEYLITRAETLSEHCFGCGLQNEEGLHARFFSTKEGHMLGIVQPRDSFQGYPNRMHGGVIATILDETMGRAINLNSDDWGVTINLNISYRKPVPLDSPVYCRSKIIEDGKRIFLGLGEIILETGEVAVQAEGRFMRQDLSLITGEKVSVETLGEALIPDPQPVPQTIKFPTRTGLEFTRMRKK